MTGPPAGRTASPPARRTWLVAGACVVAMLVFLVARRGLDGPYEQLLAAGLVAVTIWLSVWAGASASDLGLARRDLGAGARWGVGVGLMVAAVIVAVSRIPAAGNFFDDDRYADLEGGELALEVLVRVPFGTALFEEMLFRGVLLGLLTLAAGRVWGIAASSALFGLWHVLAAGDFADTNDGFGSAALLAVVAATVLATGVAGVGLAWLRLRSGSVLAPTLVHAAANGTALLVAAGSS